MGLFNFIIEYISVLIGADFYVIDLFGGLFDFDGEDVSSLREGLHNFLLGDVIGDELNEDVRIERLGQVLRDLTDLLVVSLQLVISLAHMSIHYQKLIIVEDLLIHGLKCLFCVFSIFEAHIPEVFCLSRLSLRNKYRLNFSKFSKHFSQLGIICPLWEILHVQIVKLLRLVLSLIFLLMLSYFYFFAFNIDPISLFNGIKGLLFVFKRDVSKPPAGPIGVALQLAGLDRPELTEYLVQITLGHFLINVLYQDVRLLVKLLILNLH